MNAITPSMRAILDTLDTRVAGAEFVHILRATPTTPWREVLDDVTRLLALGLVAADQQHYSLTEAGCDARWALLKAECGELMPLDIRRQLDLAMVVRPVHFGSREAMQAYLSGAVA